MAELPGSPEVSRDALARSGATRDPEGRPIVRIGRGINPDRLVTEDVDIGDPSQGPAPGSPADNFTLGKGMAEPVVRQSIESDPDEKFDRIELVEDKDKGVIRKYGVFNEGQNSVFLGSEQAPEPETQEGRPLGETLGDIDEALNAPFAGFARGAANLVGNAVRTAADAVGAEDVSSGVKRFLDMLNQVQPDPDNPAAVIGAITGDLSGQFLLPAAGGIKFLTAAGASPLVATLITDSLIGFAGVDPDEEALANLIPEDSEAFGALREVLATDPDDSTYQNRLRNMAEAVATLGLGEAIVRNLPRAIEQAQRIGKGTVESLQNARALPALAVAAEDETDQSEEVQVAGLLSKGLKAIRRIGEAPEVQPDPGPLVTRTTIRPATEEEGNTFLARLEAGEDPVGVDFNFDNFNAPDSVKRAIDETSELVAPQIETATRGVVRQEATEQMAEQLDVLPDLFNRNIGETFNAEKMVAARMLLAKSARKLDELAQRVRSAEANDIDMVNFRKQMAIHSAIQMEVKGAQSEIARALASFRIPVDAEGEAISGKVDDLLKQFGGRRNTKDLADAYLAIPDPAQRNKFALGTWASRTRDAWLSIWINGLLSSPMTHIRNVVGNAMFKAWSIPETLVAGGIGQARQFLPNANPDRVFATEAVAQLFGFVNGFGDALRLAGRAFVTGAPSDPISKLEAMRHRSISGEAFNQTGAAGKAIDYLGAVIESPGRFLTSQDEFFKAIAGRMENYALAYRQAQQAAQQGATLEEATDLMVQQIRNPDPDLLNTVEDATRYYTFTNELGSLGKWVQQGQQFAPVRIVLPFVKTPINILKAFASRNPITAPMLSEVRRDFAAGGATRDLALARISLGSGAMAYGINLAMNERITGSGPTKRRERQALRDTGWQPYSFFFKKGETDIDDATIEAMKAAGVPVSVTDEGVYVSFAGLEPVGLLFGVAADTFDIMKWQTNEEAKDSLAMAAVMSIYQNMKDRSFMEGLSQFARAADDGENFANGYLQSLARSGAIIAKPFSALLNRIEQFDDPTVRDKRVDPNEPLGFRQWATVWNAFRESTPGLSKDLPPLRNLWGQPIKRGAGKWYELFNPFYISPKKFTPVENEIIRLDGPIGLPQRKIGGVDLSPEEYSRFVELQGTMSVDGESLKPSLLSVITSSEYGQMTDPEKADLLRNIHGDFLEAAKEQMRIEFPELEQRIEERRILIEAGVTP